MLKHVIALMFLVATSFTPVLTFAGAKGDAQNNVKRGVNQEFLVTPVKNQFSISEATLHAKLKENTFETGEEFPPQTAVMMMFVALIGFVALSNRRGI